MPDDLDLIFRCIPRFATYEQAAYVRDLFDMRDVRLWNVALDAESENQARQHDAATAKQERGR